MTTEITEFDCAVAAFENAKKGDDKIGMNTLLEIINDIIFDNKKRNSAEKLSQQEFILKIKTRLSKKNREIYFKYLNEN